MLRACTLDNATRWDKSLPYAEFSYNNSYQASLQMSPFETLYGRACRTPLNWLETAEQKSIRTRYYSRSRRSSVYDQRKVEDSLVQAEELC